MADINKDSVKASKPQSDKDVNMSSASKAFGAETLEAPTAGGGMVARDDAYCFVYKKCMDSGVTLGHYRIILGEMQENVNMRYATNDDEEWKKWKVQSMVWDYFCTLTLYCLMNITNVHSPWPGLSGSSTTVSYTRGSAQSRYYSAGPGLEWFSRS